MPIAQRAPMQLSRASISSHRIRYVVIAFALVLATQLFAVIVSGSSAKNSSVAVAEDAIERESDTAIESILRHLDPAEQSVEITTRLVMSDLLETANSGLERYLYTQLAVMPQMTGAFIGYPDGSFVFVSIEGTGYRSKRISVAEERTVIEEHFDSSFNLESTAALELDAYDPTARPWYSLATASDELVWTEPYVFFSSQQPGVTASKAIRVGGEVVAVVGVDVELSGLAAFLDDLSLARDGEAFVVSENRVLGAPTTYETSSRIGSDGEFRLLTTDELGVPVVAQSTSVQRVANGGSHDLVLSRPFPADQGLPWSVVVRAPEASFTGLVSQQQQMTLLISVGGGFLVVLALLILWRSSRPIGDLHEHASTDALTGLANRRSIDQRGVQLIDQLAVGEQLSVMVLDLDGFKTLNDQHGHHTGDKALRIVGRLLLEATRDADLVGRLGGDEFIVAQSVRNTGEAVEGARRVLDHLTERLSVEFPESNLGVTSGIAVSDGQVRAFADLVMEADVALLNGKADYKGMLQLSSRMVSAAITAR